MKPFARYDQAITALVQGASASSVDFAALMLDNSAITGGTYAIIRKLTFYWSTIETTVTDRGACLVAVMKQKEGSTSIKLDDEAAVRDAQEQKQMLRGPWLIAYRSAPGGGDQDLVVRKTIVLQNVKLGPDDDIRLQFTTIDSTSSTFTVNTFAKMWWRSVA